jgi:hypothetical protein
MIAWAADFVFLCSHNGVVVSNTHSKFLRNIFVQDPCSKPYEVVCHIHNMTCVKPLCGCECASGRMISCNGPDAEFCTSRCQCTLCGGDGTGCTVGIVGSLAKIWWFERRKQISYTDDELVQAPMLCADCLDHAVPMSTQQALKDPKARDGEDDQTNRRVKKKRNRGADKSVHEADGSTH